MKHLHTSLDTLFKPTEATFTSPSLPSGPTIPTRMPLATIKSSRCAWKYDAGEVSYVILPLDTQFSYSTPKPFDRLSHLSRSIFYQFYLSHVDRVLYFRSEDEAYLQCYLYGKHLPSSKLTYLQATYPEYFI
jgi:hypothetical protein